MYSSPILRPFSISGSLCCLLYTFSLLTNAMSQTQFVSGKIYWTNPDFGMILSADLQTGEVSEIVTSELRLPRRITLDHARNKMYWIDGQTIRRATLDGEGSEALITGLKAPRGLALDLTRDKLYWSDQDAGRIQRADLDGNNIENLVVGLSLPYDIALDTLATKLYWTTLGTIIPSNIATIQRANLDGTNDETLVSGLEFPRGLALDLVAGKMYWADAAMRKIQRSNLDGSNIEDLIEKSWPTLNSMALDIRNGKMYWANTADATSSVRGSIERADLDGSNVETVVTNLSRPIGMTLDLVSNMIYWTTINPDKIQRSDLDGNEIEDIIVALEQPFGLALDRSQGKIYWTEYRIGEIRRADLDGRNIETVISGLFSPYDVALNVADRMIYWSETNAGRILSADTQGNEIASVISNKRPAALSLDHVNGKIYWTERNTQNRPGLIHRADLDGSNPDTLITNLSFPLGLVVDPAGDRIYWAEQGVEAIRASDLGGSNLMTLIELEDQPLWLEFDGQILYWSIGDKIQTANLQDREVRDLVSGLHGPFALAVYLECDSMTTSMEERNGDDQPAEFLLSQNHPNPFNAETLIRFELAAASTVTLQIFNLKGGVVRTLLHQKRIPPGLHNIRWDGRDDLGRIVSSAIYFYRVVSQLSTDRKIVALTKKMTLLR